METILAAIIAAAIALVGLYFNEKSRLTKIMDDLYSLMQEWQTAKCQKQNKYPNEISDIQLQMKHLLVEARRLRFVSLSQPQVRLLADICDGFLYYEDAQEYWEKCIRMKFSIIEIEAEYHRRYAQFLYDRVLDYSKGEEQYKKALALPSDNDGRRYINFSTHIAWIDSMFNSESNLLNDKDLYRHNTELLEKQLHNARKVGQAIRKRVLRDICREEIRKREDWFGKRNSQNGEN